MSDTLLTVTTLLLFAYLASQYKRQSLEAPSEALPIQDMPDVKRYKHNGQQNPTERIGGNSFQEAVWPEVSALLS